MFQLYNFYVLYVLNTRHKLYMKLYMVSELSISFLVFAVNPPPPHMVTVRVVSILLECIHVIIGSVKLRESLKLDHIYVVM